MSNNADKSKAINKHQQHQSHSCSTDCGCHSHSSNSDSEKRVAHSQEPPTINSEEISVLQELAQCNHLPVSRFIMSSSTEKEASFVSLAPVVINALDDSMKTVKKIGTVLSGLEKKGLITLNYDIPLKDYDYTQHTNSVLFGYFTETVNKGKENPNFLCDTAEIEFGFMALTEFGARALKINQV